MALGALGGVTVIALLLNRAGFRPATLLFWALFAAVAAVHELGVVGL